MDFTLWGSPYYLNPSLDPDQAVFTLIHDSWVSFVFTVLIHLQLHSSRRMFSIAHTVLNFKKIQILLCVLAFLTNFRNCIWQSFVKFSTICIKYSLLNKSVWNYHTCKRSPNSMEKLYLAAQFYTRSFNDVIFVITIPLDRIWLLIGKGIWACDFVLGVWGVIFTPFSQRSFTSCYSNTIPLDRIWLLTGERVWACDLVLCGLAHLFVPPPQQTVHTKLSL